MSTKKKKKIDCYVENLVPNVAVFAGGDHQGHDFINGLMYL